MKFHKRQIKLKKYSDIFIFLILLSSPLGLFALDDNDSSSYQDQMRSCTYALYPLLNNKNKSDVLDAGKMDIKSNGEIYLSDNVFIGLNEGKINADSATYFQNENLIRDIKNGRIYHSNNYFNFLAGSLEKKSGELKLANGTSFLRERNLLVGYGSLKGNLGEYLEFKNATLTSCNNDSEGWKIEAASINIDEKSSRGYIEDMKLKILNREIFTIPYLPFPATTKRLSGFLEP